MVAFDTEDSADKGAIDSHLKEVISPELFQRRTINFNATSFSSHDCTTTSHINNEDQMMSGSTKFPALLRLSLLVLIGLSLTLSITPYATAATADVVSFNAYRTTSPPPLPITIHKIDFSYTATWSESDRKCLRTIDWYENNAQVLQISSAQHNSSPVSASGTDTDAPRSAGSGNYYKILIEVRDVNSPYTLFASDAQTDGSF
jgi:hypothetical protein